MPDFKNNEERLEYRKALQWLIKNTNFGQKSITVISRDELIELIIKYSHFNK